MATPIKRIYDTVEGSETKEPFYPETSAEAVMITDTDGLLITLKTYLDNLKLEVPTPDDGLDGKGIDYIETWFGTFPREVLSVADVVGYSSAYWTTTLLEITEDRPTVWKRYRIHYIEETSEGVTIKTMDDKWTYEFCGTLGASGKSGTSTEYIYRDWDANTTGPSSTGSVYSTDLNSDFQKANYCPSGWSKTPPNVTDDKVVYISQRTYNGELWEDFTTPSLWGTSGKNASEVIFKVLFTIVDDGETPLNPENSASLYPPTYNGEVIGVSNWSESIGTVGIALTAWQTIGIFDTEGVLVKWSDPIRISGPTGKDGKTAESLYISTVSQDTSPDITVLYESTDSAINYSFNGWYTSPNNCWPDGNLTNALWMATRVKNNDGSWEDDPDNERHGWPEYPLLVSIYGHEGVDGDGIQFIYLRLTENEYKFIKDHWNFGGHASEEIVDPDGVTRVEPCSASISYLTTSVTLTPTVKYEDNTTCSGEYVFKDGSVNYSREEVIYSGFIDKITICDYDYEMFSYKITQSAIEGTKLLFINDAQIVKIAELATDSKISATWGEEMLKEHGVITNAVINKNYIFKVTKNDVDDTDNWTGSMIENSDFIRYVPNYTISESDSYIVSVIINQTEEEEEE